ncbi:GAF domain-containing protein [Candidatus Dojkabacteria bacterium]|nr:GAF domain-containing protein [Candidatus Dojkabacteria bacterium]
MQTPKEKHILESLLELSQKTFQSEKELTNEILDVCLKYTGSEVGYFHFYNDDKKEIQLHNWSGNVFEKCYVEDQTHYDLAKAGIWADCVRERKPFIHNDYKKAKSKKGLPKGHFPLIRHMSLPVFWNKKIVAIIGVGNKKTNYNDDDRKNLELLTSFMWRVLIQFHDRQALEQKLKELEKINELMIGRELKMAELKEELKNRR